MTLLDLLLWSGALFAIVRLGFWVSVAWRDCRQWLADRKSRAAKREEVREKARKPK